MSDLRQQALDYHALPVPGKIAIELTKPAETARDLALAYSPGVAEPVLVASADGVGTKLAVARMAGDFSTVGRDLVNHCVNDILVQGG